MYPDIMYLMKLLLLLHISLCNNDSRCCVLQISHRTYTRVYPQVSGPSHNKIYAHNNKHLKSNTTGYGSKTH